MEGSLPRACCVVVSAVSLAVVLFAAAHAAPHSRANFSYLFVKRGGSCIIPPHDDYQSYCAWRTAHST